MLIFDQFKEFCGNLGGYEADFMCICSYLVAFATPLKNPPWTFIGLRSALDSNHHDSVIRDVMRRCFVLAGRNIIGGMEDPTDNRMDRALARLMQDKEFEYSILLERSLGDLKDITETSFVFLSQNAEVRARVLRFLFQVTLDNVHSSMYQVVKPTTSVVGIDRDGFRYYFLSDSNLEIGCWKEIDSVGAVELIATTTEGLLTSLSALKAKLDMSEQLISKGACSYCRKRTGNTSDEVICDGCQVGTCHYRCIPANELLGFPWTCSGDCRESCALRKLSDLLDQIEPLQRAAMRKRRRLAAEIHSLEISSKDFTNTENVRTSRRGRHIQGQSVDYSFRDYDKAISDAIRKSERKSEHSVSDEEYIHYKEPSHRPMSRDERMALRSARIEPSPAYGETSSVERDHDIDTAASIPSTRDFSASNDFTEDIHTDDPVTLVESDPVEDPSHETSPMSQETNVDLQGSVPPTTS